MSYTTAQVFDTEDEYIAFKREEIEEDYALEREEVFNFLKEWLAQDDEDGEMTTININEIVSLVPSSVINGDAKKAMDVLVTNPAVYAGTGYNGTGYKKLDGTMTVRDALKEAHAISIPHNVVGNSYWGVETHWGIVEEVNIAADMQRYTEYSVHRSQIVRDALAAFRQWADELNEDLTARAMGVLRNWRDAGYEEIDVCLEVSHTGYREFRYSLLPADKARQKMARRSYERVREWPLVLVQAINQNTVWFTIQDEVKLTFGDYQPAEYHAFSRPEHGVKLAQPYPLNRGATDTRTY